jgi:hypothetical protein
MDPLESLSFGVEVTWISVFCICCCGFAALRENVASDIDGEALHEQKEQLQ